MIASALIGVGALGIITKKVIDGWNETKKAFATSPVTSPLMSAVTAAWDRAQTVEFLKLFERMVIAQEKQADHQGEMVDRRNQEMGEKLELLVEKVESLSKPPAPKRIPERVKR